MRLDHKRAKFPDPSERLFEGMAMAAYREYVELWESVNTEQEAGREKGDPKRTANRKTWEMIDEDRRLVWKASMREVWKYMAIAGGAKKRRIDS